MSKIKPCERCGSKNARYMKGIWTKDTHIQLSEWTWLCNECVDKQVESMQELINAARAKFVNDKQ